MRRILFLGFVFLLVIWSPACETEQPLQEESQTYSLGFTSPNASVISYNVWDLIEDNDDNNLPDDGIYYRWCETYTNEPPINADFIPWHYSLEISMIAAGETEATPISSEDALAMGTNLSVYPPSAPRYTTLPKDPITVDGRTFRFLDPRKLASAEYEIMHALDNPLIHLLPEPAGGWFTNGLCSIGHPGDARIDGVIPPMLLTVPKGATLLVSARPAVSMPGSTGLGDPPVNPAPGDPPTTILKTKPTALEAVLTLNGRKLNVNGTVSGDAISFSYTNR